MGDFSCYDLNPCWFGGIASHFSLVTDPADVCVITRKEKMPIVVSVADCSVFNSIIELQEKN